MDVPRPFTLDSRLYVELVPDDTSRALLNGIRFELEKQVRGRFITPLKWHVTVIHFGKVQDVYNDVIAVKPSLDQNTFLDALNTYAKRSANVLPESLSLTTLSYDLFGDQKSVLVLRLNETEELIKAHAVALEHLLSFFKDCGIDDHINFMENNHNFKHALDIKPHITMIRKVPAIDISSLKLEALELHFLPAPISGI